MTSTPVSTPTPDAAQIERTRATISSKLRAFTDDYPWERGPILDFMIRAAHELPAGARVLDVGAGEAPYAELFGHLDYRTSDWQHSVHPGARRADYIGSADNLPVGDREFDAVINTQVLEHVAEPNRVMAELYRVLRPGGRLYLSAPLAWELHEEPYDFYRYTPHGLRFLAQQAGFITIEVRPRNDSFSTLAQLLRNASYVMGRRPDGFDQMRQVAAHTLRHLSDLVASYAPLDTLHIFPLGYTLTAVRPTRVPNARTVAVAAFGAEVIETPHLLEAYAAEFCGSDDVSLVLLGSADEHAGIAKLVERFGLDSDVAADLLAATPDGVGRDSIDAVYSRRAVAAPLDACPRFDDAALADLHHHVTALLTRAAPRTA